MKKIMILLAALVSLSSVAYAESRCNAHTTCSDGRVISCWSYGDSCTWNYVPGVSVTCTGYDDPNFLGAWQSTTERCW